MLCLFTRNKLFNFTGLETSIWTCHFHMHLCEVTQRITTGVIPLEASVSANRKGLTRSIDTNSWKSSCYQFYNRQFKHRSTMILKDSNSFLALEQTSKKVFCISKWWSAESMEARNHKCLVRWLSGSVTENSHLNTVGRKCKGWFWNISLLTVQTFYSNLPFSFAAHYIVKAWKPAICSLFTEILKWTKYSNIKDWRVPLVSPRVCWIWPHLTSCCHDKYKWSFAYCVVKIPQNVWQKGFKRTR